MGAGVLGAAAAFNLARMGLRTIVLERRTPNQGGSGATAGNLHIQAINPLRPGQGKEADARRFLPLQIAASALWDHVEDELDATIDLQRSGGFMVAETEAEVAALTRKHALEQSEGLPTELVEGETVRRALPLLSTGVLAALWCAQDGFANPGQVTPAYLEAAKRLGAEVRVHMPLVALRRLGVDWIAMTPEGAVAAPLVLDLAGSWMAEVAAMAGIALAIRPIAIQVQATSPQPSVLRHLVQHAGLSLSVKQVRSGELVIGGGWPAERMDLLGESAPSEHSTVCNIALAARVLPFLADLPIDRVWAGPLVTTPDELPVVGEVPGAPGFLVAGGTYSFTLAPLWGLVLAQLATGRPPAVNMAGLGPARLMAD
ncbi:MAG: FAD-dependent oxidoreductase [Candidatus Dormiibacterota bacterium]